MPAAPCRHRCHACRRRRPRSCPAFVTFHLVCVAWIFFRASSFEIALRYGKGLATFRPGPVDPDAVTALVLAAVAMFAIDGWQRWTASQEFVLEWRTATRGLAYACMVVPIVIFSGGTSVPFIYFQF